MSYKVGIDIGSTTLKAVVLDQEGGIIYKTYQRHYSKITEKLQQLAREWLLLLNNKEFTLNISGSAGLGAAKVMDLPFVQEVFALHRAVSNLLPQTDVVVELGGEDAKIIFLTGGFEDRMNGACAGGTGAFIDQMATLMGVSVSELDDLSLKHTKIYPIASRCGVFAKSDIQPLINQGAKKEDIAASIYQAVVEQTIAGLAQGRKIQGKVLFLGGPLYFLKGLQQRFTETLRLEPQQAYFPDLGQYFVAIGACLCSSQQEERYTHQELVAALSRLDNRKSENTYLEPLFADEADYAAFVARHQKNTVETVPPEAYNGSAYLGIDVGSTTTKLVLIDANSNILYQYYTGNQGNPLPVLRAELLKVHQCCGDHIQIVASAVTGYGEELVQAAFGVDYGVVETIAHFTAAKFFNPGVDYIIDIGGQDMKCFKIRNNTIDNIILNEACSSGCGSFVQSFAEAMGHQLTEFTKLALFAKHPVDLGSRCTVFMNSSVKQAQREGATVGDVSAGLAISVIKNAIYKVLRINSPQELGENILVQGGTFLNDAILRSFERELKHPVIRPNIAGLMGAYGSALYAKARAEKSQVRARSLLPPQALEEFSHRSEVVTCGRCTNKCGLTINTFPNGKRYISGNKCQLGIGSKDSDLPNSYEYALKKVRNLVQEANQQAESFPHRPKVGIPMVLNMYENLPFWQTFFLKLGINLVFSGESNRELYSQGQFTIPSDTVCYPAKLVHGHMESLLKKEVDTIFYPCMSYNFNEAKGDNHFNCPVVAYYPELLHANIQSLQSHRFLFPYLSLADEKLFVEKTAPFFKKEFSIGKTQLKEAARAAYVAYAAWQQDLKDYGLDAIQYARKNNLKTLVLAGRPYHIDREINHSIDKVFTNLGFVVISELAVADLPTPQPVNVLNQWTYHARLYNAARYVSQHNNIELAQLVSFGCGLDAITTDEVKDILERNGKIYTQLKIDEINNLGAVKIRARSLLATLEEQE